MSRLNDPGCMLRATSALFGAVFLPVGVSFFFVLHRQHWMRGAGAVAAALGFFYVAWRGYDILGLDNVGPGTGVPLPELIPRPGEPPATSPDLQEPRP